MADRWYVPLLIAAAVVIALLVAGLAALEVFATRNAGETSHIGRHAVAHEHRGPAV